MKIRSIFISLCCFPLMGHANSTHLDYVTSVKVNHIELNGTASAHQIIQLFRTAKTDIRPEYVECTGNYEYTMHPTPDKTLKFEIFAEDNPKIKTDQLSTSKIHFKQLGQTQGRVWITWNNSQQMTENIRVQNIQITPQYTLGQFKQDFKQSAQSLRPSGETQVLFLQPQQVRDFLKNPQDYSPPYTAYLNFSFNNGKLNRFAIQQAIAC